MPGQPAQWGKITITFGLDGRSFLQERRASDLEDMITSIEVHPRPVLALGLMLILLHLLGCPCRLLLERLSTCLLITTS